MTLVINIALGYINIPFEIKSSTKVLIEEDEEQELEKAHWTFENNTLSISCFVKSPPTVYPTLEKHVLQSSSQAQKFEKEQVELLSKAMNQPLYGLMYISNDLLAILSNTNTTHIFSLQIVRYQHGLGQVKSYTSDSMDIEQCLNPTEIMSLCQLWPNSKEQLMTLSSQIYQLASLYGYWDYWRVFEGICNRHHINPEQLLNGYRL